MPDRHSEPHSESHPESIAAARSPGTPMVSPEGTPFFVATGFVCLDVLYTGGEGERRAWEKLLTPEDLARWISECALVSPDVTPTDVTVTAEELDAVRELREAIWRGANDLVDGERLPRWVERSLSRFAAEPTIVPRLCGGRRCTVTPFSATQACSVLARDAIELLTGPQSGRLRRCDAHDCNLLFVDTSRPGRRRWCAMARCGNRAKVRAHRRNAAADPTAETAETDRAHPPDLGERDR